MHFLKKLHSKREEKITLFKTKNPFSTRKYNAYAELHHRTFDESVSRCSRLKHLKCHRSTVKMITRRYFSKRSYNNLFTINARRYRRNSYQNSEKKTERIYIFARVTRANTVTGCVARQVYSRGLR